VAVHSHKAYEQKKRSDRKPSSHKSGTGPVKRPAPPPVVAVSPDILYELHDPETRTFCDVIVLRGREVRRDCRNGMIKTRDSELADFQISKGWILLNKQEVDHGKK